MRVRLFVDFVLDKVTSMGRKKAGVHQDMETTQLRAVRLELPADVHRALRLEAATQDVSLGALARIAVEDYLKRKSGGREGK
jgi:hypothetical protein